MREILFRGKDHSGVINHSWCIGSLDITEKENPIIIYPDRLGNKCRVFVDTSTVGQYTGLTDKNGTKIFEGDILKYINEDDEQHYITVVFEECAFLIEDQGIIDSDLLTSYTGLGLEVAGNVFDNPELIERSK